jgi:hypothetical protein
MRRFDMPTAFPALAPSKNAPEQGQGSSVEAAALDYSWLAADGSGHL